MFYKLIFFSRIVSTTGDLSSPDRHRSGELTTLRTTDIMYLSHFSLLCLSSSFIMKTSLSSTFSMLSWGPTFDKVDNQTIGDTLQKLSRPIMENSSSGSNRILLDDQLTAMQLSIH